MPNGFFLSVKKNIIPDGFILWVKKIKKIKQLHKSSTVIGDCCCPGSNWGPLVCKTNVITTTPQQPSDGKIKLNLEIQFFIKIEK